MKEQRACPYDGMACEKTVLHVNRDVVSYNCLTTDKFYVSVEMSNSCDQPVGCDRYQEHKRANSVPGIRQAPKEFLTGYKCPHESSIDCGLFYRCDEFWRQKNVYNELNGVEMQCAADVCQVQPNLCPRYINFLKKQKVRQV